MTGTGHYVAAKCPQVHVESLRDASTTPTEPIDARVPGPSSPQQKRRMHSTTVFYRGINRTTCSALTTPTATLKTVAIVA
ncbi:hypothetical protein MRB53_038275 [Persea americana]|nr:hypothetical protein MRB53_038275 [Persea americana]